MADRGLDVVGGGAASIDTILFVDGTLGDAKGRVLRREQRFGGNVATALVAAARLGARVGFIGHLPDEASSGELLAFLREEEVDYSCARISPDTDPIVSTILVDRDGKRFIAFEDNSALGLPEDLDLDIVRSARVLLVDEYGLAGGVRAAAAARDADVAVVADIERATEPAVRELFSLADHLILPRDLALAWTGTAAPAEAVHALWRADRSAVIVTGGSDGCWYRAADEPDPAAVHYYPAITVDVVDTTGCGDVFHGTYAARLALGGIVADCIAAATAAAAYCATHPGGIGPRPTSTNTTDRR
jgi:sugar/nucleoside kinase (ribokinase family)